MRFVVLGAGAVGGVVGARLHQAGFDVALIARGAHLRAIAEAGLRIEDPDATAVVPIAAVGTPDALAWHGDEVVLLATKSQDSSAALHALRATAPPGTAVVCVQNAVENERLALRLFADVYGAVVMVPATHLDPGVVQSYGTALSGVIDVGRYPSGVDERAREIAEALRASRFESSAREDVMRFKYAKLIMNLGNAIEAAFKPGVGTDALTELARAEGREVLRAAQIEFEAGDVADVRGRWERMGVRDIAGRGRAGSSSWQSLARGTGSVEADFLNGEVVLLGRTLGIETPVNEFARLSVNRLAHERAEPRSLVAEDLLARLGLEADGSRAS
jgi:2-dehydropantoate 2-reductase